MKIISYLNKLEELSFCKDEVILSCDKLSRFSKNSKEELISLYEKTIENSLDCILEWDILMQEYEFSLAKELLLSLPEGLRSKIRVNDPGAIYFLRKHFPKTKIQLNLEVGNHNKHALQSWIEFLGDSLDRVILSIELPKAKISEYINEFPNIDFELLGLGRILIFYTPRKLVSIHTKKVHSGPIEISASSEESPHKGFPVVENNHGTFMFNTKDFSLIEYANELKEMGLKFFRVDNRFLESQIALELDSLQEQWPAKTHSGFYRINKSDVLFKKLKNKHLSKKDETFLGEILSSKKDKYLGLQLKNPKLSLSTGDKLYIISPEGKEKEINLKWLKNPIGQEIKSSHAPHFVLIPPLGGISSKSMVYLRKNL